MKLSLRRVSVATPGAHSARQAWPARHSVVLSLTDEQGHRGRGEASPLPGYSMDTLAQAEQSLAGLSPSKVSQALEHDDPRKALSRAACLLPDSIPSARMAFEAAVLDLLGQRRGLSAPALLGCPLSTTCSVALLLGAAQDEDVLAKAERGWLEGYRHFKLKVGARGGAHRDAETVAQLRATLGPLAHLRLDANGALDATEAEALCRAVEPHGIEFFEEPSEARLATSIPIALDESLQGQSEEQLASLVARRGAKVVVLKPMALGGLWHCLRLATRARELGVGGVISHAFDGPIALRAAATLALTLRPLTDNAHGLAPHTGLPQWGGSPSPVSDGFLRSWSEPGLAENAELMA